MQVSEDWLLVNKAIDFYSQRWGGLNASVRRDALNILTSMEVTGKIDKQTEQLFLSLAEACFDADNSIIERDYYSKQMKVKQRMPDVKCLATIVNENIICYHNKMWTFIGNPNLVDCYIPTKIGKYYYKNKVFIVGTHDLIYRGEWLVRSVIFPSKEYKTIYPTEESYISDEIWFECQAYYYIRLDYNLYLIEINDGELYYADCEDALRFTYVNKYGKEYINGKPAYSRLGSPADRVNIPPYGIYEYGGKKYKNPENKKLSTLKLYIIRDKLYFVCDLYTILCQVNDGLKKLIKPALH